LPLVGMTSSGMGRHDVDEGFVGVARDNRGGTGLAALHGESFGVKAEPTLALVRAVTLHAAPLKHGPDVDGEVGCSRDDALGVTVAGGDGVGAVVAVGGPRRRVVVVSMGGVVEGARAFGGHLRGPQRPGVEAGAVNEFAAFVANDDHAQRRQGQQRDGGAREAAAATTATTAMAMPPARWTLKASAVAPSKSSPWA
jgi:hypothetical protein